ncbi:MAG: hypothetical protein ACQEXJ_19120 [Myxococcota bacterium]
MRTSRLLVPLTLAAVLGAGTAWAAEGGRVVVYEGQLQDADRKPIGGVFPLSFSLHESPRGGRSAWTESHFVAVDSGEYAVELGKKRPIPPDLDMDRAYLAVSITGGAEIVREQVDADSVKRTGAAPSADGKPSEAGEGKGGMADYADTAGLAYEAEHAKAADKIGTLSEEALLEKLKEAAGGGNIGSNRRYTGSAGGEGGVAYELNCPEGHVVTGVRGGSGIYLDSIQLICQPLE